MEEDEEDSDNEPSDANVDSDDRTHKLVLPLPQFKMKNPLYSPTVFSPITSPKTSPQTSSPKPDVLQPKNEHASLLRLKSLRVTDSTVATSLPVSPSGITDYSISSAESDGEVIVRV